MKTKLRIRRYKMKPSAPHKNTKRCLSSTTTNYLWYVQMKSIVAQFLEFNQKIFEMKKMYAFPLVHIEVDEIVCHPYFHFFRNWNPLLNLSWRNDTLYHQNPIWYCESLWTLERRKNNVGRRWLRMHAQQWLNKKASQVTRLGIIHRCSVNRLYQRYK